MDAQPFSLCNSMIYTYIFIYIIYIYTYKKGAYIYIYEAPNLIDLLSITCYFVNMLSVFFCVIYTATFS